MPATARQLTSSQAALKAINAGVTVTEELTAGMVVVGLNIGGRVVRHDGTGWYNSKDVVAAVKAGTVAPRAAMRAMTPHEKECAIAACALRLEAAERDGPHGAESREWRAFLREIVAAPLIADRAAEPA